MSQSVTPVPPFLDTPINDKGRFSTAWNQYNVDVSDALANLTSQLAAIGQGVTDGSDAAAGKVGEYQSGSGSLTLSNTAVANVASLNLGAGDWDVSGNVVFVASAGTHTLFGVGIGGLDTYSAATFPSGAINQAMSTAVARQSSASATTVWLVARADFTSGTVTASGTIRARRVR
jgi:hypothetical protein